MRTDQEVGGEVEVVGGGAVDGVAVVGWFNNLDVSPTIEGPRLRAAWATGDSDLWADRRRGPHLIELLPEVAEVVRSVALNRKSKTEFISEVAASGVLDF